MKKEIDRYLETFPEYYHVEMLTRLIQYLTTCDEKNEQCLKAIGDARCSIHTDQ